MRGIGWNLDKETKIRILQERATKYNQEFDHIEAQGKDPEAIRVELLNKEYTLRHANQAERTLPFNEDRKVISANGLTDLGFDQAHKILTSTKQMYQTMENKVIKKKENKLLGILDPDTRNAEIDSSKLTNVPAFSSPDLAAKQKETDEAMKKKIYQDHLNDLFASEKQKKNTVTSNYQDNFRMRIHPSLPSSVLTVSPSPLVRVH